MENRERSIAERESSLAEREKSVAQREAAVARREQQITESHVKYLVDECGNGLPLRPDRESSGTATEGDCTRLRLEILSLRRRLNDERSRNIARCSRIAGLQFKLKRLTILSKQSITLLSIPAEIRVHIYRWLFTGGTHTVHASSRQRINGKTMWQLRDGEPSIARTCKLIRSEALPAFYAQSTFKFRFYNSTEYTLSSMFAWERSIGACAQDLRHLEVTFQIGPEVRAHPWRPNYNLKVPILVVDMKMMPKGTFIIKCFCTADEVGGARTMQMQPSSLTEQYCACGLYRQIRGSYREGGDGRRLLNLARMLAIEKRVLNGICQRCKMPSADVVNY